MAIDRKRMNVKTALYLPFYDIANSISFAAHFCFIKNFKIKNQLKILKNQAAAIQFWKIFQKCHIEAKQVKSSTNFLKTFMFKILISLRSSMKIKINILFLKK